MSGSRSIETELLRFKSDLKADFGVMVEKIKISW